MKYRITQLLYILPQWLMPFLLDNFFHFWRQCYTIIGIKFNVAVQFVFTHICILANCRVVLTKPILTWREASPAKVTKNQRTHYMEKSDVLFVIREHNEHLFGVWLHHSGLLTDIDAIQKLPDVLLSDCGGLLDQGRWKEARSEWETWSHTTGRRFNEQDI